MTNTSKQLGFTAVELLVTLFIAAAFLTSGYQLYSLIMKDGGEARATSRASNIAYDYLQRYKSLATDPCTTQTPLYYQPITESGLTDVTISVSITCPYPATTSVSKILVSINFNYPQQTINQATYVKP